MKDIEINSLKELIPILSRIGNVLEFIEHFFCLIDDNITISNKEVIETLCVSASTLYRLRKDGSLPFVYLKGEITYKFEEILKVIERKTSKSRKLSTQEMLTQLYSLREKNILELTKNKI